VAGCSTDKQASSDGNVPTSHADTAPTTAAPNPELKTNRLEANFAEGDRGS